MSAKRWPGLGVGMRWTAVLVLLAGMVGGIGGAAQAAPARQVPSFGQVAGLALDANGDGWAWAGPATGSTNFLLRLEGGAYRVAASTTSDATLLPPKLDLTRLVL